VFLAPKKEAQARVAAKPGDAKSMLAEARLLLDDQDKAQARLRAGLEQIDRML
jgi:hypothetical protein